MYTVPDTCPVSDKNGELVFIFVLQNNKHKEKYTNISYLRVGIVLKHRSARRYTQSVIVYSSFKYTNVL